MAVTGKRFLQISLPMEVGCCQGEHYYPMDYYGLLLLWIIIQWKWDAAKVRIIMIILMMIREASAHIFITVIVIIATIIVFKLKFKTQRASILHLRG